MRAEDQASPETLYPSWQKEYEAAIQEPNIETLPERIEVAEGAIERRLQQLAHDSNHHTERQVIRGCPNGPSPTPKQSPAD
jgi:hypothetical protein